MSRCPPCIIHKPENSSIAKLNNELCPQHLDGPSSLIKIEEDLEEESKDVDEINLLSSPNGTPSNTHKGH